MIDSYQTLVQQYHIYPHTYLSYANKIRFPNCVLQQMISIFCIEPEALHFALTSFRNQFNVINVTIRKWFTCLANWIWNSEKRRKKEKKRFQFDFPSFIRKNILVDIMFAVAYVSNSWVCFEWFDVYKDIVLQHFFFFVYFFA